MTCGECAYFEPSSTPIRIGTEKVPAGYCHRYPPAALNQNTSAFPIVLDRLWCGEFRPAQAGG